METAETSRHETGAATNRIAAEQLMRAMRERDFVTMESLLAPEVVVKSPITDGFQFRGRDSVIALLKLVRETMYELEHRDLVGADDVWTQFFRVRVGGRAIEGIDLVRFDAAGEVCELTVFMRPLPGLAAFAAAVVPAVGRRRGRLTSLVLRLLTGPLGGITRHGDRFAVWLLRGAWTTGT